MPGCVNEGDGNLLDVTGTTRLVRPAREAATRLPRTALTCPSCGSAHVAQMLGDNGGISYVCTACGHSWS